jgi:hypothetical protein
MKRKRDERTREAQGRKSRQTLKLNQLDVLLATFGEPSTFSQLLKKTGFSKPVLAKHLKFWRDSEMIYKDTIKPLEATKPEDVGKVVYRTITGPIIPEMVAAMEIALQLPKPHWEEESEVKLRKHLEAIASIILDEVEKEKLR